MALPSKSDVGKAIGATPSAPSFKVSQSRVPFTPDKIQEVVTGIRTVKGVPVPKESRLPRRTTQGGGGGGGFTPSPPPPQPQSRAGPVTTTVETVKTTEGRVLSKVRSVDGQREDTSLFRVKPGEQIREKLWWDVETDRGTRKQIQQRAEEESKSKWGIKRKRPATETSAVPTVVHPQTLETIPVSEITGLTPMFEPPSGEGYGTVTTPEGLELGELTMAERGVRGVEPLSSNIQIVRNIFGVGGELVSAPQIVATGSVGTILPPLKGVTTESIKSQRQVGRFKSMAAFGAIAAPVTTAESIFTTPYAITRPVESAEAIGEKIVSDPGGFVGEIVGSSYAIGKGFSMLKSRVGSPVITKTKVSAQSIINIDEKLGEGAAKVVTKAGKRSITTRIKTTFGFEKIDDISPYAGFYRTSGGDKGALMGAVGPGSEKWLKQAVGTSFSGIKKRGAAGLTTIEDAAKRISSTRTDIYSKLSGTVFTKGAKGTTSGTLITRIKHVAQKTPEPFRKGVVLKTTPKLAGKTGSEFISKAVDIVSKQQASKITSAAIKSTSIKVGTTGATPGLISGLNIKQRQMLSSLSKSKSTTKQRQASVSGYDIATKTRVTPAQISISKAAQKTAPKIRLGVMPSFDVSTVQKTGSVSKLSLKMGTGLKTKLSGETKPPPMTEAPLFIPTRLPPLLYLPPKKRPKKKKKLIRPRRKARRLYRYTPSLAGMFFGRTAKKAPRGAFTGLGIRPLIKKRKRRKR